MKYSREAKRRFLVLLDEYRRTDPVKNPVQFAQLSIEIHVASGEVPVAMRRMVKQRRG